MAGRGRARPSASLALILPTAADALRSAAAFPFGGSRCSRLPQPSPLLHASAPSTVRRLQHDMTSITRGVGSCRSVASASSCIYQWATRLQTRRPSRTFQQIGGCQASPSTICPRLRRETIRSSTSSSVGVAVRGQSGASVRNSMVALPPSQEPPSASAYRAMLRQAGGRRTPPPSQDGATCLACASRVTKRHSSRLHHRPRPPRLPLLRTPRVRRPRPLRRHCLRDHHAAVAKHRRLLHHRGKSAVRRGGGDGASPPLGRVARHLHPPLVRMVWCASASTKAKAGAYLALRWQRTEVIRRMTCLRRSPSRPRPRRQMSAIARDPRHHPHLPRRRRRPRYHQCRHSTHRPRRHRGFLH